MAAVIYGLELLLIVELASAVHQVTRAGFAAGWAAMLLLSAALLVYWMVRNDISARSLIAPPAQQYGKEIRSLQTGTDWFEMAAAGLIALQLALLLLVAYLYPPGNFDSMTYHLGRVMHWAQNRSVDPYASNIIRQIELSPFAEYNLLNLFLLKGNDRYVNFPQLWAMLVCAIGASDIAARFGAERKRQWLAALLVTSIPMAILQASSTQNDLAVAGWLIIFTDLGLLLLNQPGSWSLAILTGASLGLGLLTKATLFLFALPVCVYFGTRLLQCLRWKAAARGGLILALVLLINSSFLVRNQITFGNIFGSNSIPLTNTVFSPSVTASNLIRTTALSFSTDTGVSQVNLLNQKVKGVLSMLHHLTGLTPNDPRTSFTSANIFLLKFPVNEDFAGSPLHTTLLIFLALYGVYQLFIHRNWSFGAEQSTAWTFLLLIISAFLLFSALLKFQIWHNRLILPLLVLACPVIAAMLPGFNKNLVAAMAVIFGTLALNYPFVNNFRPIAPDILLSAGERNNLYFVALPDSEKPYNTIIETIRSSSCKAIGIKTNEDRYEYPIWALLGFTPSYRIEHILVENATQKYAPKGFAPCAVIADADLPEYENRFMKFKFERSPMKLYLDPQKQ